MLTLVACGGGDDGSDATLTDSGSVAATAAPATDSTSTEAPGTDAPVTEAPVTEAPSTTAAPGTAMRSLRYCEVVLLAPGAEGIVATVYNSYPLNDCPQDQWEAIDTVQVATDTGAVFVLKNGPRFWLMDSVERDSSDVVSDTFGDVEMNRYATVTITDTATMGRPYTIQRVDRKARFTFDAGSTVYFLTDADGRRFVMQSWSQQVEPTLSEADLADIAPRLQLPEGWTYGSEVLTSDLTVDTTDRVAEVLQDPLLNTYSFVG